MPNALTEIAIRNLPVPTKGQRDVWDPTLPGFGVRVSQGGSKTFVLNLYNSRRSLGRYGVITLAQARTEAKRLLAEKTLGKQRPQQITYKEALRLFLEEKQKTRKPRTYQTLKQRLEMHFPFKGQLAAFTHQEFARRLSKIGTKSEHDHALSVGRTFFTWCYNRRFIDDNPTRGLSPHGHKSRARVLSDDELKLVWKACEQSGEQLPLDTPFPSRIGSEAAGKRRTLLEVQGPVRVPPRLPASFAGIVQLLIITGMRRTECSRLKREYFSHDQQTLCLPGEITKNGREHTFPVAPLASKGLGIIITTTVPNTTADTLLFPARGKPTKPFNGWSKSKKTLDELSGVSGWRLHDLRRTFATIHARIGTPPHIIERLLNHVSGQISGVAAIYNRHHFLPEMRAATEAYEAELQEILGE